MLPNLKEAGKAVARSVLRRAVYGDVFRIYARGGTSPEPGPKLRIAVCHLIPFLGDAVMLFPLLDALREENPKAEISCFVAGAGSMVELHPGIDHVYVLTRKPGWGRKLAPVDYVFDIWRWWHRELRGLQFDVCVVPRGGVDPFHSAHLAWLLGGRERVGYSNELEPDIQEHTLYPGPLLTKEVRQRNSLHEVTRGEEILKLAGLLESSIDLDQPVASMVGIARSEEGRQFVAGLPDLRQPYGIVSPGASIGRKRWPDERFSSVARQEIVARGWLPVFVGGPDAGESCDAIAAMLGGPYLNLTERTNFQQLAAVCAGAQCFIGNDSGTGHVAAACGVRTLMVTSFARNSSTIVHASPDRTRFLGPYVELVQPLEQIPPCVEGCIANEAHCVLQVQVDEVQQALQDLIQRI